MVRTVLLSCMASALTAVCAVSPARAAAGPSACQSLIPSGGGMLRGTLCTNVMNGQLTGRALYWGSGTVQNPDIQMYECNAAETSCAAVPGSHAAALVTPTVAVPTGRYYKTCVSFQARQSPSVVDYYNTCTGLATS